MFSIEINEDTVCETIVHGIPTNTNQPVAQRNFQTPKLLEKEIDKNSRNGKIRNYRKIEKFMGINDSTSQKK
jgi:hypothetical protein